MKTTTRTRTLTIETTDTEVVQNNPNRVELVIVNNGVNEIHLDIDNTVSSTSGLRVAPSGSISLNKLEDGSFVTEAFFGVATTNAVIVRIFEVVKTGEKEE